MRVLKSRPARSTVFSRMFVTTICCALGALLRDNMLMSAFCLYIGTYIIDLLTRAHSKLSTHVYVYVPFRKKLSLFSVFFVSYCHIFYMRCDRACWTTRSADTCQPLTTILFKIMANYSSKYLLLPAYEFLFLYIFNSLLSWA